MKQNDKQAPVFVGVANGKHLSVAGGNYRVMISGKETNGAFAVIEMQVPPGGGPGPHAHAGFDETFYVLEGEVDVTSEAGSRKARTGDYVAIPTGGIVHCFKNNTDKLARLLCTVTPAGLEDFFEEIGQPAAPGEFTPPKPLDEAGLKRLTEISEKYGQKLYPPDYLDKQA